MEILYGNANFLITGQNQGFKQLNIKYEGNPLLYNRAPINGNIRAEKGTLMVTSDELITFTGQLFKYKGYFKIMSVKADRVQVPFKSLVHIYNKMAEKLDSTDRKWNDLGDSYTIGMSVKNVKRNRGGNGIRRAY